MKKNNFTIKLTKTKMIHETNCDMAHNYYFLINFRIINKSNTRYCPMKLIQWFDIDDILDYYEKDCVNDNDLKEYAEVLAFGAIDCEINDYNERERLVEYCNKTIEDYNRIVY